MLSRLLERNARPGLFCLCFGAWWFCAGCSAPADTVSDGPEFGQADAGPPSADVSPTRTQTPVYVTVYSHNEDNDACYSGYDTEKGYLEFRDALLQMVGLFTRFKVAYNFEPEWRFLEAAQKYEQGAVLENTNGKNILRYLAEDLGVQIDPHSHEHRGYNYADVAYLIDAMGVKPSGVVGGFIAYCDDPNRIVWEKFRQPLTGQKYDYVWRAEAMMGASTPYHQGDTHHTSGLYRPKSKDEFTTHEPQANLINIGACGDRGDRGTLDEIENLIEDIETGVAPAGKLYNANITTLEYDVLSKGDAILSQYENILEALDAYVTQGKVTYVTYNELIDIWKTHYAEEPNIYECRSSNPR